ncbi:MAG: hypothetical protein J5744_09550, partial [Oscillospiraceae bacterium]|nr:hypothetical protein [Oscillospiraceae bacterium]
MSEKSERRTVNELLAMAPVRHCLILASAAVILFHLMTRNIRAVNVFFSERLVQPAHRAMSVFFDLFPFSFAEILIGISAAVSLIYIVYSAIR